jgi:hypothetical protein
MHMKQEDVQEAALRLMRFDSEGRHPRQFASEDLLQAYCYRKWNKHFRHLSLLHSVPNGANISDKERSKMIATGLLSGAADLELKMQGARIAHIELKNGPKDLEPKQKVFRARIEALGHQYWKATNFFEFWAVICHCLNVEPTQFL